MYTWLIFFGCIVTVASISLFAPFWFPFVLISISFASGSFLFYFRVLPTLLLLLLQKYHNAAAANLLTNIVDLASFVDVDLIGTETIKHIITLFYGEVENDVESDATLYVTKLLCAILKIDNSAKAQIVAKGAVSKIIKLLMTPLHDDSYDRKNCTFSDSCVESNKNLKVEYAMYCLLELLKANYINFTDDIIRSQIECGKASLSHGEMELDILNKICFLLVAGSEMGRETASQFLIVLSYDLRLRSKLVELDILSILLRALESASNESIKSNAALALSALLMNDDGDELRIRLINQGVIPLLLDTLRSSNLKMKRHATLCIYCISRSKSLICRVLEYEIISGSIAFIEANTKSPRVHSKSSWLSSFSTPLLSSISNFLSSVPLLSSIDNKLLDSDRSHAVHYILMTILSLFMESEEAKKQGLKQGIGKLLVHILKNSTFFDDVITESVIRVVGVCAIKMSDHECGCELILEGAYDALSKYLFLPSCKLRLQSMISLNNLLHENVCSFKNSVSNSRLRIRPAVLNSLESILCEETNLIEERVAAKNLIQKLKNVNVNV